MIVCVCNAKNCRTVRETLTGAPHIDTPAAAHRAMGCKPQCGRCLPIDGVAGVDSIGGYEKQFHVLPDPAQLMSYKLSFRDVMTALAAAD